MLRVLIALIHITILSFFLFPAKLEAATSTFSIRPSSGNVIKGKNFTIDVLINTNGDSSSLARAVLKFDPELVTVTRAERNSSLYCLYPEEEQSIDNQGGLLMITGFCQSGVGFPYKTTGSADVFARVTFKTLKTGTATLSWEYTGEDIPFNSVIVKDGSPPSVLLTSKPKSAVFKIVNTASTQPTPTPTTPNTGLSISLTFVVLGGLLLISGFVYAKIADSNRKKSLKTIVDYEK